MYQIGKCRHLHGEEIYSQARQEGNNVRRKLEDEFAEIQSGEATEEKWQPKRFVVNYR